MWHDDTYQSTQESAILRPYVIDCRADSFKCDDSTSIFFRILVSRLSTAYVVIDKYNYGQIKEYSSFRCHTEYELQMTPYVLALTHGNQ